MVLTLYEKEKVSLEYDFSAHTAGRNIVLRICSASFDPE